ncbi:MAG: DUF427 domain-containing protein [Calditrichaeota bacterium]|nr:DUF427 domain-containing protein [Calditrichota bacterium]RQW03967.1 MAG: DUF427 domain-containing protein [Calditrichota bacterium]
MENVPERKPGQESVWDYPRPPRLENFSGQIEIFFNKQLIVKTIKAKRVLETSHPPVYYIPPEDVRLEYLQISEHTSWCEWKGGARYYDIAVNDRKAEKVAWFYPDPDPRYLDIKDYIAFYAGPMDACYINGEKVIPQPGGFYGGWITSNIVGPFKGKRGTLGW